jgi:transcriptional regulator EpsA
MTSQVAPADNHFERYIKIIGEAVSVSRHQDLLLWLQGDIQNFLPHDILIAGWGNFEDGTIHHDIVSKMSGVRSCATGTDSLPFLLSKLHERWVAAGKVPLGLDFGEFTQLLGSTSLPGSFSAALRTIRTVMVHGLLDQRERRTCLYVLLRSREMPVEVARQAFRVLMPSMDTAMRQITHLPQQYRQGSSSARAVHEDTTGLSEREAQIMAWVAMGKTNSEIGSILNISGYTVKNHMQRIFHKLNVFNRTQAVSRVTRVFDGK